MADIQTKEHKSIIGPKTKGCLLFTHGYMLFLTYVVLTLHKNVVIQASCLFMTMIALYVQLLLIQDYYFIRLHSRSLRSRKDIRLLEPLLPERFRRKW